ncbi:M14 family zinc carboxypeptidase [Streptomyces himalayensis]|uniref:3-hydroxyacyl-CoA dehydrogenase n=2 Tax=Streptomyces himalayensis TaxID=2820085 RepID=A0A7W2CYT7_9ACTN|nr:M14 family zinc carboxypeptidase [Streptomyces himalayensis]MBA2947715.1 3-hydroxyacyl-CoA dehydrogenase [Streptomyces himalayensis subsp. himalayensis]MBA4861564.1 3-hydroxyacyl-CoA dehydrogenase [Streptomyces himalayensis subsp. aureolus]
METHPIDQRYPSVTELTWAARELAAHRPDLCELRQVGTSRAGRPLHLLSVGRASRAVLVVAGAHANEPTGGSTLLYLAERALHDRGLRTDVSWHFLLCADPDGASLHRTPAPRSLLDYHRNFFRPAGPEQPEWSPSVLPPDRLPPETLALTGVIDELRPYLQVSLHSTDLGGTWVQLTKDIPGLAEPFAKSAAELHIPVETGASDAAGWPASGPGVHVMPAADSDVAFPSLPDDARHSTWHHAHRYGGLTAIVEVPMWASDLVGDPAPHPAPAEAMRRLSGRLRRDTLLVEEILAEALPRLAGAEGPLLRAARWALELVPGLADDWRRPPPQDATMAYVDSIDAFGRRLPLRAAAMLLRVLRESDDRAAPRLNQLVTHWCAVFAARFRARWVPLDHQVEHQARTVVEAMRQALAVTG